jgi:hypothetical protein
MDISPAAVSNQVTFMQPAGCVYQALLLGEIERVTGKNTCAGGVSYHDIGGHRRTSSMSLITL